MRTTGPHPDSWIGVKPLHYVFWRSVLILFSYLRFGLPADVFSSGAPGAIFYAFIIYLC
jgi:hypothetical protein